MAENARPAVGASLPLIGNLENRPGRFWRSLETLIGTYTEAASALANAGARAIVPYLRGFGPTRFVKPETPRSGEQAALGADLLALMDALHIDRAILAGYDWGGRATCIVSALWPERVVALVSRQFLQYPEHRPGDGAGLPVRGGRSVVQYYFHSERGRRGLMKDRRGIARLLWRMWSPNWDFDEATFERSATAFDNPDFVEVVIHSYRHRYGLVPGDPAYAPIEAALAAQPVIIVPTITVDGDADGVNFGTAHHAEKFAKPHEHRVFSPTFSTGDASGWKGSWNQGWAVEGLHYMAGFGC